MTSYYIEAFAGGRLAYRRRAGTTPAVVFLCGFRSDMSGTKARFLDAMCEREGFGYLRFDYQGHGESDGRFEDGTIGRWADDAVQVIDATVDGPVVLVGSSMGAWIMVLAARRIRAPLAGLVGVAAAPDFTVDLMWERLGEAERETLRRDGVLYVPSQYDEQPSAITMRLIEEGREHLVLRSPIEVGCPVHLIHGLADPDVPWETSMRLAERIRSEDVVIELVKDGDHRLSRDLDLARLERAVLGICRPRC